MLRSANNIRKEFAVVFYKFRSGHVIWGLKSSKIYLSNSKNLSYFPYNIGEVLLNIKSFYLVLFFDIFYQLALLINQVLISPGL